MEPRSNSDILKKTLTLHFGEKDYEVPVLRMTPAAKWRKEWFERTKEVSSRMDIEDEKEHPGITKEELRKTIGNAVLGALLAYPDKIPELVFSYAPSLPQQEILEAAYDDEFALAFKRIWQVAFSPFLESMGLVLEMQTARASQSVSSESLN